MDVEPTPLRSSPYSRSGAALLAALWIIVLAVVVVWWEPTSARYDMTVRVHGLPVSATTAADWLAQTSAQLKSHRSLLQAAESLVGRYPSPTAAELAAFRQALEIGFQQDAAGNLVLVLRYAGNLSQGPALVETLARHFVTNLASNTQLQISLTDASTTAGGFPAWGVGLVVMLAVFTGGWILTRSGRADRPLASPRRAQSLLGVPVLAVEWPR